MDRDTEAGSNDGTNDNNDTTIPPHTPESNIEAVDHVPPVPRRPSPKLSDDGASAALHVAAASRPTTQVSTIDISTLSFPDGSRGTFSTSATSATRSVASPQSSASGYTSPRTDLAETVSVASYPATLRPPGDLADLVTGEFNRRSRAWSMLRTQSSSVQPFEASRTGACDSLAGFEKEFDKIPELGEKGITDEQRLSLWKSKMKHYMILSSAGKPIWSRHGDTSLINSYMGVVQTIISFYEGAKDPLLGFTAGNARFVISTQGPLYFVAISRLGESDAQLRSQLDALYMQILSTLTLPTLKNIFVHRPSTDLRKPLEGTESLLSSLADSFTKGSPSALLGALECLRLRKSHRATINNAFLKCRSDKLLYGLIVAGGKLVSVIRPRKHSLHPSDLQLIFNMLFESGGIRAGGGENWVPLCLPAFNNRGYLYMYVSFFDSVETAEDNNSNNTNNPEQPPQPPPPKPVTSPDEEIAIILISADKESFFELKSMRDKLALQLAKNGSLALIQSAARQGRPRIETILNTKPLPKEAGQGQGQGQLSHFLYKSRANVQFCQSSLSPAFETSSLPLPSSSPSENGFSQKTTEKLVSRRRLMTLYHHLHASIHAKHSHLKVLHLVSEDAASLAWITPVFEFYCVAGPNMSSGIMTQCANKVVQWAKREEERLFIIGGGVF
ncbi:trafficking protein Mon1-domain-containing protein [Neurospora hispaniola]|uniref:Vacuolar fusion protein MON1 n=1 Tax=Neurospora hispaniola TaxID=588809 RepID=A0AAJ0ICG6_9PEZI|nr:trafficking protein Mon1-domain-containing protein [Neurospora hispaniola]